MWAKNWIQEEWTQEEFHLPDILDEDNKEKKPLWPLESVKNAVFGIMKNWKHKKRARLEYYLGEYAWKILWGKKHSILELNFEWLYWKELPIVKDVDFEEIIWKKKINDFKEENLLKWLKRWWKIKIVSKQEKSIPKEEWVNLTDEQSLRYKNEYTFEYQIKWHKINFSLYTRDASLLLQKCLWDVSKHYLSISL
jgi:hypothetical protein